MEFREVHNSVGWNLTASPAPRLRIPHGKYVRAADGMASSGDANGVSLDRFRPVHAFPQVSLTVGTDLAVILC